MKITLFLAAFLVFSSCDSKPAETNNKNAGGASPVSSPSATPNTSAANSPVNSTVNKNAANKPVTKNGEYDPFTGSVLNLMPKEVNAFYRDPSDEGAYRTDSATSVKDSYITTANREDRIVLSISNYPSSAAAQESLEIVSKRENLPTTPKMKNGKKVGIRISAANGTNLMWTNGSLFCFAMGAGNVKASTVKSFEEKLAF